MMSLSTKFEKFKGYKTQWASQFYVAAELTRRGYLVALTLGNAQTTDLMVISQSGKQFKVDVKGLSRINFWLVKRRQENDLYYILVYLPEDGKPPRFFVMTSEEVANEIEQHKMSVEAKGRVYKKFSEGFNWSVAFKYENKWDKLPA